MSSSIPQRSTSPIISSEESLLEQRRESALKATQSIVFTEQSNKSSPFPEGKYQVRLYTTNPKQRTLGKDILQVPCRTNFDNSWHPISKPQRSFLVHHMGAPDLESLQDSFDENTYLLDMRQTFQNALYAQSRSGAQHAVWGPLSIVPFLNSPEKIHRKYQGDEEQKGLQTKAAKIFFTRVSAQPALQIHLCFLENYLQKEIFLEAYKEHPSLKGRVVFHENQDPIQLAQDLANEVGPYKASLAHTTHTEFVGHSWLSSLETCYTDELRSRSTMTSFFDAYFDKVSPAQAIRKLGACIIPLPQPLS